MIMKHPEYNCYDLDDHDTRVRLPTRTDYYCDILKTSGKGQTMIDKQSKGRRKTERRKQ